MPPGQSVCTLQLRVQILLLCYGEKKSWLLDCLFPLIKFISDCVRKYCWGCFEPIVYRIKLTTWWIGKWVIFLWLRPNRENFMLSFFLGGGGGVLREDVLKFFVSSVWVSACVYMCVKKVGVRTIWDVRMQFKRWRTPLLYVRPWRIHLPFLSTSSSSFFLPPPLRSSLPLWDPQCWEEMCH